MVTESSNLSLLTNFTSQSLPSSLTASIWLSAFAVLGLLIIIVNVLTIATIFFNTRLRMYCIINLAIADLLRGIFEALYQICNFALYINDPHRPRPTYLHGLMMAAYFAGFLSLFSLVLIAMERVFAAFFPARYRTITLKSYLVAFLISWCLALLISLFFHFDQHAHIMDTLQKLITLVIRIILISSLVLIIGSYIAVYIKMHRQVKIQQQHCQLPQVVVQRAQKERHLAITLFIVTALSLTAWIPYFVVRLIYSLSEPFINLFKIIPNIVSATFFVNTAISLINPLVYVFRIKDFRKAMLSMMCGRSCCERKAHPMAMNSSNNQTSLANFVPRNATVITPRGL